MWNPSKGLNDVVNNIISQEFEQQQQQPDFDVPVAALRPSSQNLLSRMLNPVKIIPSPENGLPR